MSAEKYGYMADQAASRYGIPIPIFRSLIQTESGWNAQALGKSGDTGLTQLTPIIYKSDQYKTNPWNPQDNLNTGAKFLSDLQKKYGNWRDALSHYNAGFNLSKGRGYADKVLNGAITYNPTVADLKNLTSGRSYTPILDAAKAGQDPTKVAAEDKAMNDKINTADDTPLQKKISEFFHWFAERIGIKLILGVVVVILIYLAITRMIK